MTGSGLIILLVTGSDTASYGALKRLTGIRSEGIIGYSETEHRGQSQVAVLG